MPLRPWIVEHQIPTEDAIVSAAVVYRFLETHWPHGLRPTRCLANRAIGGVYGTMEKYMEGTWTFSDNIPILKRSRPFR